MDAKVGNPGEHSLSMRWSDEPCLNDISVGDKTEYICGVPFPIRFFK